MKCALTTLCVFGAVTCALGYTDIPSSSSFTVNGVSYSYYDPNRANASNCTVGDYANGYSLVQTGNRLDRLIVGYVDSRRECAVSPKPIGAFELASQFDWTASNGTVCHQEMNWIGPDAFLDCCDMTELNVGYGYIAMNSAFKGCRNLQVVRLPSTMQAIGGGAFSGLTSLAKVEIPLSLQYLGASAFYNCRNLSSQLFIPEPMICVGDFTFANCHKLPEITIPEGIVKIGSSAFQNCYCWTRVILPQTVREIGSYAFSGLVNVPSLTLASGVTNIGSYAFSECSGVHDVYVGVDVEDSQNIRAVLGDGAFSNCLKLERVYLGPGVKELGKSVFSGCSNLKSISFMGGRPTVDKTSLASVNPDIFFYIKLDASGWALGDDNLPERWQDHEVRYIPINVQFDTMGGELPARIEICDYSPRFKYGRLPYPRKAGHWFAGWYTAAVGGERVTVDSIVPDEDTELYAHWVEGGVTITFDGNGGTTDFDWVNYETDSLIDYLPFATNSGKSFCGWFRDEMEAPLATGLSVGTTGFTVRAEWADGEWLYDVINDSATLRRFNLDWDWMADPGGVDVTMPEYLGGFPVVDIGERAFFCSTGLTSIVVADGVTNVSDYAFAFCFQLNRVALPKSVKTIGDYAASYSCVSDLIMDCWVERIGDGAFEGTALSEVVISTNTVLGVDAFDPWCLVRYVETDSIAYKPSGGENIISVPLLWLNKEPIAGLIEEFDHDYQRALQMATGKRNADGSDVYLWQEYIVGTDPSNTNDVFRACISIVRGVPVVSWMPKLTPEEEEKRRYLVYGKKELLNDQSWVLVTDEKFEYNFFKVVVEMKR